MPAALNVIDARFGRLVVIEERESQLSPGGTKGRRFLCRCDCGVTKIASLQSLRKGTTQSCGCLSRERNNAIHTKHGETANGQTSPEYVAWRNMIARCENPKSRRYQEYGGRGIAVCKRWRDDYAAFLADVGRRPSPAHSLDRYPNVNGNYEPGNVRWAVSAQQARNMRSNRFVQFAGQTLVLKDACALAGVNYSTVRSRLKRGLSVQEALSGGSLP